MNIINNIDPKPAKYVRVPTPEHFKSKYEEDKYWDGEFKKWNLGYSGLTGLHYFTIQECVIPDGKGRPIRPYWRDGDDEWFQTWDGCEKDGEDLFTIKRREWGLSTFAGGVIPLYKCFTNPNSDSVFTSASKLRVQTMFKKKTEFIYDRLNPYYKQEKARKTQAGHLMIGKEDRATKTFSGLQSSIWGIDTIDDPHGFENFRAVYGFIDEVFLHSNPLQVHESAQSCFMEGFDKYASMIVGGTCGKMTYAGAKAGFQLYKASKDNKTVVKFMGGTKCIKQFSVNGWTDEKAAEEYILKERERLIKLEDKTPYYEFVIRFPLSIEEVFNLQTDCLLPHEVQITLADCEKKIESEGYKEKNLYIISQGTHEIKAIPDALKGKINIVKAPVRGHQYIMGTDTIPFVGKSISVGSENSSVVLDRTVNEIVADYTERNLDSQQVVYNTILLQKLYYNAVNMVENNVGEVYIKEYIGMGEHGLLAMMPTHLGISWEERQDPYGFRKNNHIGARLDQYLMKFLLKYAWQIRHKRFIEEVRWLWSEKNLDLLDAVKAVLLYDAELTEMEKITTFAPTILKHREMIINPLNGAREYRTVSVPIRQRN